MRCVLGPIVAASALAVGCGPAVTFDKDGGHGAGLSSIDQDGDGYSPLTGDCDDTDPGISPAMPDDTCNGIDEDCSGRADDPFDVDGDGWTTCRGDCNDRDPTTYPGAPEYLTGTDQDCDGIADNNRADFDDDGDGFTELEGDCNDAEYLVNPEAVEVAMRVDGAGNPIAEGVDNDCDGKVDEGPEICDVGLDPAQAGDLARAMELCKWTRSAGITTTASSKARNIVRQFGATYVPRAGSSMVVLATGVAADQSDPRFVNPNEGTPFQNTGAHPNPQPDPADGCGAADPSTVYDVSELTLELRVPTNARSFSFDFNFMSGEFPEWVCSLYDDTFLVLLESSSFHGNVSFDAMGRPVTVNIGFFEVCEVGAKPTCTGDEDLRGTGYDGGVGGGTGWLTTTAPVTPGEIIRLRFMIFDEGDRYYDSLALIDNFRWDAKPVDRPITIPRDKGPTPAVLAPVVPLR
jgi:hypothetical protein